MPKVIQIILAAIIGSFCILLPAFAAETPTATSIATPVMAQQITQAPSQNESLLQSYNLTNDSINRLMVFVGVIAAILGLFITIVFVFFAIRQFSADKEIREYRNDLKRGAELVETEREAIIKQMQEAGIKANKAAKAVEEIEAKAKEIENKPDNPETQKQLKELAEKVEGLKQTISFQSGRLSPISPRNSVVSSLYDPITSVFGRDRDDESPLFSLRRGNSISMSDPIFSNVRTSGLYDPHPITSVRVPGDVSEPITASTTPSDTKTCPKCKLPFASHTKDAKGNYQCPTVSAKPAKK